MRLSSESTLRVPVGDRDHREGPADAAVTLVEYGDYECPYCGEAYLIVKQVQKALGTNLQFVFRNFPLSNLHPHAQLAAEAAESAGAQGKFWEMHDAIYEHQSDLSSKALLQLGASIGIDPAKLQQDLEAHTYESRVYDDFMSGARSGVNGTPTFFINGQRFDGSWDYDSLVAVLNEVAKASK